MAFALGMMACKPDFEPDPKDDEETDVPDTDSDTPPPDTDVVVDTYDYGAIPEMIEVAAGSFVQGAVPADIGSTVYEISRTATISYRFEIGRYEVRQGQFSHWMGDDPSYWGGCAQCPVESITWHEAAFFANKLSESAGLASCFSCVEAPDEGTDSDTDSDAEIPRVACQPAMRPGECSGYRLPTEAEWEYAARSAGSIAGPTTTGGGLLLEEDGLSCVEPLMLSDGTDLAAQAWYCGNSDATPGKTTRAVGLLSPNTLGAHDMLGNVWEMTLDLWLENYPGDETDPIGALGGTYRVVRGGGWNSLPKLVRVSFRSTTFPANRSDNLGFRLARTLDVATAP